MNRHYQDLRPKLLNRDFNAVNDFIDQSKKSFYRSEKNRLLFYMDKGMVLHLAGRYEESNAFMERAKTAAQELWTESVAEHIQAALTTDNALSYAGEDFERVLLHFVAALNYIGLRKYDSARVEARQVTNRLELYNQTYSGEHKNVYKDDAFARWLSGKLAETEGGFQALNDAWIDYRKAIAVYEEQYQSRYGTPLPDFVVQDALRVTHALGQEFSTEFRELRSRFPHVDFVKESDRKGLGELVFIHLGGEAPYKVDDYWTAHTPTGPMRIAFPRFVKKRMGGKRARIQVAENEPIETELAEDIAAIAVQNLKDHMGRIRAKAIARAIGKQVAAEVGRVAGKGLQKAGHEKVGTALEVGSLLFKVGSAIAEEADKRSWVTLPARIGVTSFFAPPGEYSLEVDFVDSRGDVVESAEISTTLQQDRTAFVFYRTFR